MTAARLPRRLTTPAMLFREYSPADRDACLALFDGNVPRYFAPHERDGFAGFLDALPGPYFVVEEDGAVVACGGYAFEPGSGEVALCWGIVDARRQREGIGTLLTAERLRLAAADSSPRSGRGGAAEGSGAVIRTSQHTAEFYARLGFTVTRVEADGHAPGIDFVEMRLAAPAEPPAAVEGSR